MFELFVMMGVLIGGLIMGAVISATMQPKVEDTRTQDFSGPRSNYGEPIPYVFGTVQVASPLCIYGGGARAGNVFGTSDEYDATDKADQYFVTLDLVLAARIKSAGTSIGSIRLRRLWYGDSLLWDGTRSGYAPLTTSKTLLEADPKVNDIGLDGSRPGGITFLPGSDNDYSGAWWFGGIIKPNPNTHGGEVLGYHWAAWGGSSWTQCYGLERVRFYAGNGSDVSNAVISGQLNANGGAMVYPAYPDLIRVVLEDFCFGPQPSMREISAELTCACPAPAIGDIQGLWGPQLLDVNPISVLYRLLTMPEFCGSSKVGPIDIASFTTARQRVQEDGLFMSYELRTKETGNDLIETILDHVDGFLFQEPTDGSIKIKLYRPALEGEYVPKFTDSQVLALTSLEKTTWAATFSQSRITFNLRGSAGNAMYAQSVAIAKDPGLGLNNELEEILESTIPTVYDGDVANNIAARKLAVGNAPLVKVVLEFSRLVNSTGATAVGFRPGDLFDWDSDAYGFENFRMRVTNINLGRIDDNRIRVTAIQDRFVPPPTQAAPKPPQGPPPAPLKPDVQITVSRMITAPFELASIDLGPHARNQINNGQVNDIGQTYVTVKGLCYDRFFMLAKRPYAGAASFAWNLIDNDTGLRYPTKSIPYTPCGTLLDAVAALPVQNKATSSTPFRVGGLSSSDLAYFVNGFFRDGRNLILLDDEWILVEAFTVLDSSTIQITTSRRMIWDSACAFSATDLWIPAHTVGANVWLVNANDIRQADKLSDLLPSNKLVIDFFSGPPRAWNLWQIYASGYGTAKYKYEISNQSVSSRNLLTTSALQILEDRANRIATPRAVPIDYNYTLPSVTNGVVYNSTVLNIPTANTSVKVRFDKARNSKDSDFLVIPWDTDASGGYPIAQKDQDLATFRGTEGSVLAYPKLIAYSSSPPDPANQFDLGAPDVNGYYTLSALPASKTFLFTIWYAYEFGVGRVAWSAPRTFRLTVNRV